MLDNKRRLPLRRLTYLIILVLFTILAIVTTRCGTNPEIQEALNQQSEVVEEEASTSDWGVVERIPGWARMWDKETNIVCYSPDNSDQQSCFYIGGQ